MNPQTWIEKGIAGCLNYRKWVVAFSIILAGWGLMVAPFDWHFWGFPRAPISVDAIPNVGENQQIVYTEWPGRSPKDVENQVTYPLTATLLGLPHVKTIRGYSMAGFSTIYIIFDDKADYYTTRTRILEKLESLPQDVLPEAIKATLGPDATALSQIFWYTLEGQDEKGHPTGGWDLEELRRVQDWQIKNTLLSAKGVSEVASIGGFQKEYQVDVDPNKLKAYRVSLEDVLNSVRQSNADTGAKSIEVNQVDYLIRGIGLIRGIQDIENTVIKQIDGVSVRVKDVAVVQIGPQTRQGVLDKNGVEAVGGVVVSRFGENPLEVIRNLKQKIAEINAALPSKTLPDGRISHVAIVPFYDRSVLIHETLGTLNKALIEEMLVTVLVVMIMVMNLPSAFLISGLLPLAVLMTFIAMSLFRIEANIMALSGIAIAIGTLVDMGIIVVENCLKHLEAAPPEKNKQTVIYEWVLEVASPIITSMATIIVGFLPVFMLDGPEGKLFHPLAFTKSFALFGSLLTAMIILPPLIYFFVKKPTKNHRFRLWPNRVILLVLGGCLTVYWMPLGHHQGIGLNLIAVAAIVGVLLGVLQYYQMRYGRLLSWCLSHPKTVLLVPVVMIVSGVLIWAQTGKEFMPALDEGDFLWMPSLMSHASLSVGAEMMQKMDAAISRVPEVETVVSKLGRTNSALDPAPISMIESVITYKPQSQWRPQIRSSDDIFAEIQQAAAIPGMTSSPKLHPIENRMIMLQSGIRAKMAVKITGPSLEAIQTFGFRLEPLLKTIPQVDSSTVIADRVVGKPYLEIHINRQALVQYGLRVDMVQNAIDIALGGKRATQTIEDRERYDVRIRYMRQYRDSIESLGQVWVDTPSGSPIPLSWVATIQYVQGPLEIKSENTWLTSYVVFDKQPGISDIDAVNAVQKAIDTHIRTGQLQRPNQVRFAMTGDFENLIRSEKRFAMIIPLALAAIFFILMMQFRSIVTTLMVFSSIFIAWSGGFILLGLFGQDWFLSVPFLGDTIRTLFHVGPVYLSVAVWVGFLALFGIASNDAVVMTTYLNQVFQSRKPQTVQDIREAVVLGASKRVRPCLTTAAIAVIALLPILTSNGKGADVMRPMALPTLGGMTAIVMVSLWLTPVLYYVWEVYKLKRKKRNLARLGVSPQSHHDTAHD